MTAMSSPNGLICFTNCLLPLEDGDLVEKDLWIDQRRGVILDAQVRIVGYRRGVG
jgi:N-acetylglucosamine-6-phosphate deacetylase